MFGSVSEQENADKLIKFNELYIDSALDIKCNDKERIIN